MRFKSISCFYAFWNDAHSWSRCDLHKQTSLAPATCLGSCTAQKGGDTLVWCPGGEAEWAFWKSWKLKWIFWGANSSFRAFRQCHFCHCAEHELSPEEVGMLSSGEAGSTQGNSNSFKVYSIYLWKSLNILTTTALAHLPWNCCPQLAVNSERSRTGSVWAWKPTGITRKWRETLKSADTTVPCTENLRNSLLPKLFAIPLQIKQIKENLLLLHCKCLVINHHLIFIAQN